MAKSYSIIWERSSIIPDMNAGHFRVVDENMSTVFSSSFEGNVTASISGKLLTINNLYGTPYQVIDLETGSRVY